MGRWFDLDGTSRVLLAGFESENSLLTIYQCYFNNILKNLLFIATLKNRIFSAIYIV